MYSVFNEYPPYVGTSVSEKEKKEKTSEALPDAAAVTQIVETILDQVKHLKVAVNNTIERAKAGGTTISDCKLQFVSFDNRIIYLFILCV